MSVPLGKGCQGRVSLVVHIEPSRRLGDEPTEDDDDSGTQALKPDRQEPGGVSGQIESASDSTCCDDTSGEPEGVAVSSHFASVCRMRHLDDIDGSCGGSDGHTKACKGSVIPSILWYGTLTENESATHKLSDACIFEGGSRDDCTHQDDHGADEHTPATTPSINSGTDEGKSDDTTDLVHGRNDTSPDSSVGAMEDSFKLRIDEQTIEQTSIVAVHGSEMCVSHGRRGKTAHRLLTGTNSQEECMRTGGWWSGSSRWGVLASMHR